MAIKPMGKPGKSGGKSTPKRVPVSGGAKKTPAKPTTCKR